MWLTIQLENRTIISPRISRKTPMYCYRRERERVGKMENGEEGGGGGGWRGRERKGGGEEYYNVSLMRCT